MEIHILEQVLACLERDYSLKRRGSFLRGRCPNCGEKDNFYTHAEHPWILRCGRLSKCRHEIRVRELYPDLFDDYSKHHPQTVERPNAAADAYLSTARGFDLAPLKGLYTQEHYFDRTLNQGTATVRFALPGGGWWERLIDRPYRFGKQKARFAPGKSYAGRWWVAPASAATLRTVREVWITEGIFDAIACQQHGLCAVSAMSCSAFPEASLVELRDARPSDLPVLVWALDNDPGARDYTLKHIAQAEKLGFTCRAAQIRQRGDRKTDWNDLHLRAVASENGTAQWLEDVAEARYQGDLLTARSAMDKGLRMYEHAERAQFHFDFGNRLYWFEFDAVRFDKLCREYATRKEDAAAELEEDELQKLRRASASVKEIASCFPQTLYFQRNEVTDEAWYYFRIYRPLGKPSVTGTFTSSQAMNATTFRDRLAHIAPGEIFDGTGGQLLSVMKAQWKDVKTVHTVDFIGYTPEHQAYVFGDLAVRQGQISLANAEDYFEFDKLRMKTTQRSIRLDIQRDPEAFRTDWLPWLWTCFGTHGIVALTFWFGSLFANQIRSTHKSFPFLEATGEAGAGKTTLLTFLWKLLARADYEGFDPAKSSKAGRARAMGQISGMPVVLLEADRSGADNKPHTRAFEWDELKDYFGGGTLATRGVRNGGNETYEPPFRGTIVISQNAAVDASEAILTRIVKLHFRKPVATTESRIAADNLNALQVEQVSHFLIKAVRAEQRVLERFAEQVKHYEALLRQNPDLRNERLIKNHAQMLALLDGLRLVIDIPQHMVDQTRQALTEMAVERQSAISADHPMVNEFWETYEYLESIGNGERAYVNHSRDPQRIAINLNDFIAKAANHNQPVPDLKLLRPHLRDSRRYKLINENQAVNSAIRTNSAGNGTAVRCWVFKK